MNTAILTDGLKFPESPRWREGELWFCDYALHRVMKVDLSGTLHTVAELPDLPTAIDGTPDGRVLVVSATQRRVLRLENGRLTEFADLSGLVPHPCGELVVDTLGRAYVGNIGLEFGTPSPVPNPGSILLVTPEGRARIVAEGLAFPNGMAITPDGQILIVAESHAARLTAFDIEPDGSLSGRRAWAQFDEALPFAAGRFTPDGLCLDAEGAVWVAALREVLRVREGGEVTHRIGLDHFALACMLGGQDRRTLFIAATNVLNPADSQAQGQIEMVEVEVPGAGLPWLIEVP
ncbi:SMP-30/gluconolactonase/LRE family protein [Deinococcus apachensis]|uniref:SMP-30/gluconolactonase/LRE family protein n=1 Tax=Deinococcus apachensis TaxID=309886 RepID=UPI000374AF20|nr:SMP-30/gluconolactonase/LRE family protein [Deinococcus apachensis]